MCLSVYVCMYVFVCVKIWSVEEMSPVPKIDMIWDLGLDQIKIGNTFPDIQGPERFKQQQQRVVCEWRTVQQRSQSPNK